MKRKALSTTLRIEGIKPVLFKGFRVTIGIQKGSGFFQYIKGTREQAQAIAEKIKKELKNSLYKQQKPLIIDLVAVKLKKCDVSYCNHLCESNERYCLGCEDDVWEARAESRQMRKELEIEQDGE